jgi:hypothetical protein
MKMTKWLDMATDPNRLRELRRTQVTDELDNDYPLQSMAEEQSELERAADDAYDALTADGAGGDELEAYRAAQAALDVANSRHAVVIKLMSDAIPYVWLEGGRGWWLGHAGWEALNWPTERLPGLAGRVLQAHEVYRLLWAYGRPV